MNVNGVAEPNAISNLFMEHFKVEPSARPSEVEVFNACDRHIKAIISITVADAAAVIKNMSRGRSPGYDGLSVEHLQHAGTHLRRVLALLFRMCRKKHTHLPANIRRVVVGSS